MIIESHKQICRYSHVWYFYPVALKVHFVFLLERTVSLVIETRFQVYKATGSAIVVTCTFWRNCNSSHKKGPRSLAITMRVAMIYKTLVVAVLQLIWRRVHNFPSVSLPSIPDIDIIINDTDILPCVLSFLDDTLTVNVFAQYWQPPQC